MQIKVITAWTLKFFELFSIFPTWFGWFFPADTAEKTLINLHKFSKAKWLQLPKFKANRFVTETCSLRHRDSQNWSWDKSRNSITGSHQCAELLNPSRLFLSFY